MCSRFGLVAVRQLVTGKHGVSKSLPKRYLEVVRAAPTSRSYNDWSNSFDHQEDSSVGSELTRDEAKPPAVENPYSGIAAASFPEKIIQVLTSDVKLDDIEIKPDGLIYLPEIKYRRILNTAFGPGGWGLMPLGDVKHFQNKTEGAQLITREYGLYCLGRFVSQATGEHTFYSKINLSYGRAVESAKSNALMRCCKDLGVASELWDPQFVTKWKSKFSTEVWCEHYKTKEKKKLWRKKGSHEPFPYPWKEPTTNH